MNTTKDIAEAVTALLDPLIRERGLELIDVEFAPSGASSVLRMILDREGGVSLDELTRASREASDLLDAHDLVEPGYTLECSSPGIDRPLRKPADFARFRGKDVALRTRGPIAGDYRFEGLLVQAGADGVEIEDRKHGRLCVPYDAIKKANYKHDFSRDFRRERD